jgi:chromosomal replication initiation ATPase DnaA
MADQPRLPLTPVIDHSIDALIISESNRAAWERLERWATWPGGSMVLSGPEGSGKSHMGDIWALRANAMRVSALASMDQALAAFHDHRGRLLLDDVDRGLDDEAIFLLLDLVKVQGGALLLTSRSPPADWPFRSPDLASRCLALPRYHLSEPDDALLQGVLRRQCRARFMEMSDDVARFVSRHMERSFIAARRVAEALDENVVRGARPVSKAAARRALEKIGYGRATLEDEEETGEIT